MNSDGFQEIKLITESEHHFNTLCFKIRTLASTWLLATFAGIGFISTEKLEINVKSTDLITILCLASAFGITILWILDLRIYQRFLSCWFQCRNELSCESNLNQLIYDKISATMPKHRASELIKIYYNVTVSAPILFAIIVNWPSSATWPYSAKFNITILVSTLIILNSLIFFKTTGNDSANPTKPNKD